MSVALDIGSHRIRSLRIDNGRLVARSRRSAFAVLPDSASHRQLLAQANVEFVTCDGGLLLLGDAAWEHAGLFHVRTRPLLLNGLIPEHDPVARQVLATITDAVLPRASQPGEQCSLTIPGGSDLSGRASRASVDFFTRLVALRGYEPLIVPAPSGLILAEHVSHGFTGIGLVFGGSACEAVLAHCGVIVCHTRIDRGGDWIDEQLAETLGLVTWDSNGDRFLDTATSCRLREANATVGQALSAAAASKLVAGMTRVDQQANASEFVEVLGSSLNDLLHDTVREFAAELSRCRQAADLPQPFAFVCGGGLTQGPSFLSLLQKALAAHRLPVEVQPPRVASGWPHTVTRGLLIAAELESQAAPQRRAA